MPKVLLILQPRIWCIYLANFRQPWKRIGPSPQRQGFIAKKPSKIKRAPEYTLCVGRQVPKGDRQGKGGATMPGLSQACHSINSSSSKCRSRRKSRFPSLKITTKHSLQQLALRKQVIPTWCPAVHVSISLPCWIPLLPAWDLPPSWPTGCVLGRLPQKCTLWTGLLCPLGFGWLWPMAGSSRRMKDGRRLRLGVYPLASPCWFTEACLSTKGHNSHQAAISRVTFSGDLKP